MSEPTPDEIEEAVNLVVAVVTARFGKQAKKVGNAACMSIVVSSLVTDEVPVDDALQMFSRIYRAAVDQLAEQDSE